MLWSSFELILLKFIIGVFLFTSFIFFSITTVWSGLVVIFTLSNDLRFSLLKVLVALNLVFLFINSTLALLPLTSITVPTFALSSACTLVPIFIGALRINGFCFVSLPSLPDHVVSSFLPPSPTSLSKSPLKPSPLS